MTGTTRKRGKMVNSFDPAAMEGVDPATRGLVARRERLLGPAYRLFYRNPVEVSRGSGVHLYDSNGNEYLDAYNNVVSVGHAHPVVVEAISQQLSRLCTHTRYVQTEILDFAEKLLATFESEIGHVMFTCTGSEANDLAVRIARHYTGNKGVIITSEAYHGNSFLTAGLSPSLGENSPLGTWVRRIPTPDSYRIDPAGLVAMMVAAVEEQIADLQRRGEGVAAFIADSLFSSDGIYSEPTELLAPIAEVVRKAGGIFIADEVQSGFCRSGDRIWGYQRHGLIPDLITMGKPMGNGFPVAAVAARPDIVERFGHEVRYFNTFGGNNVAIAAAHATFRVLHDEQLLENAQRVGRYLRDQLTQLKCRFETIGDVRGAGLYIGVELISDIETREPNTSLATTVVNGLRDRRVLISATGPNSNVLKIRPPLVFKEEHAEILVQGIEDTLRNM